MSDQPTVTPTLTIDQATLLADYRHFHRASKAMRVYRVADLRQCAS
jgi:hypothetical protein